MAVPPETTPKRGTLINFLDLPEMEMTKGIVFDPERMYNFEITEIQSRQLPPKEGSDRKAIVVDLICTEEESSANLRLSFFHNAKVTVSEEFPDKESPVVKIARRLGYPVGIGKKFRAQDFLRQGIKFSAKTKPQLDKDNKPTQYSEIVLDTMIPSKKLAQPQQAVSIDDATIKGLQDMAKGFPSMENAIQALVLQGNTHLIAPFTQLVATGRITFSR